MGNRDRRGWFYTLVLATAEGIVAAGSNYGWEQPIMADWSWPGGGVRSGPDEKVFIPLIRPYCSGEEPGGLHLD